jgi:hypothetical protein
MNKMFRTQSDRKQRRGSLARTKGRLLLVAAVLVLGLLPAAAQAGNFLYPGGYEDGHLFCSPGQVNVWAPFMRAQASGETVRFVDQLLRWNGSQWLLVTTTQAAYQYQTSDIFAQATDDRRNMWTAGSRVWTGEWYFTVPHGTYAVVQYLFWNGVGSYSAKSVVTTAKIGWTTANICQV